MRSPTKLEEAIGKDLTLSLFERGVAVRAIARALAADPALVEEIAPGMVLKRRIMTPAERGKITIPAMNKVKNDYREEMLAAVIPVVTNVRRLRATANGHEIAIELNKTNYGPSKTRKEWTYADVRRLLRGMKLELKPSET